MEPIDLHPAWRVQRDRYAAWEVRHRKWESDFVIVLCVVSFVCALLGGLVTYKITRPGDIPRQRLVDISHAVYKECWKQFETDEKCNEIADIVLGERED